MGALVAEWRDGVDESCCEWVRGRVIVGTMLVPVIRAMELARDDLDGDEEAEEEYITSVSMGEETPLLPGWDRAGLRTSRRFGSEEFMGR